MITNRDWWKGVFGNMVSTMLGIALTVGVAAIVEHHNDQKLSREMMFNVVKTAHDDIPFMESVDSVARFEMATAKIIFECAKENDWLSDHVIDEILQCVCTSTKYVYSRSETEKYFYSSQTMHQFNNPEIYTRFSMYVEFSGQVYEKILDLQKKAFDLKTKIEFKKQCEGKTPVQIAKEIVADQSLFNYYMAVKNAKLSFDVKEYKKYYKNLLKDMNATEEEFQEYMKKNTVPEYSKQ